MPGSRVRARRTMGVLGLMALWTLSGCTRAPEGEPTASPAPQRIVSLDYCADQFVLKLADPSQIAAVSPDAGKAFSYMRDSAAAMPRVRSTAEDVLALRPDLVVRSYGGGADAGAFFIRSGVPVAQLGFADDFDGVRANIRAMAAAMGHADRGEDLIAEMDQRLADAAANHGALSALYLTPGGVTTGAGTLVDEMFQAAGVRNFIDAQGWVSLPLEQLAYVKPDLSVAAQFGTRASSGDAWSAMRHPVARRTASDRPSVAIEGAWTACGGWFLVEAVEALAAAADGPSREGARAQ